MKSSAVFLLVVLGVAVASAAPGLPLSKCLSALLDKDLGELLKSVQALVCSYDTCQDKKGTNNECSLEEWEVLAQKAKVVLERAGCVVDDVLFGGKKTLEEITAQVGELVKQLQGPVRDLLMKLGLEEPAFKLVCGLLGDALVQVAGALNNLPGLLGGLTGGGGGGLLGK
ncbi:ranaspumin-like [Lissotriton helveticus]